MRHIIFEENTSYPIAILIKDSSLNKSLIHQHYIKPLEAYGIQAKDIIVFSLDYQYNGKAPVKFIKEYLNNLGPALKSLGVKVAYVADGNYFKPMAKVKKVEPHYGYKLPSALDSLEGIELVVGVPYSATTYNPGLLPKLDLTLKALASVHLGTYEEPGQDIIRFAEYPETYKEIAAFLEKLLSYPKLACDIETFSLHPEFASIGTIAFAWSKHEGGAFACDYEPDVGYNNTPNEYGLCGALNVNKEIRRMLAVFFKNYEGKLIYHGATFDAKILARTFFMENASDYENQLLGVDIMTKNIVCTKNLVYLATNNAIKNKLDLKSNAQEFAGNWAHEEISNIYAIPLHELLDYNLADALSTFYLEEKYQPIVIAEGQETIHQELFIPGIKLCIHTELNGMPMDRDLIYKNDAELEAIVNYHQKRVASSLLIQAHNKQLQTEAWIAKNLLLKTRQDPLEKFSDVVFNPNSNTQLQRLFIDEWDFPVLSKTKSGAPAVGGKVIQGYLAKLIREHNLVEKDYVENDPTNVVHIQRARILYSLSELSQATKIKNTFFKAFKNSVEREDGRLYLQGNFNLTGTKSGRMSSSGPNMTNLPSSGTKYAKPVKDCFRAPPGWLMVGADADSLEDKISALTTKDKNKLKVYEQGFDGHCLRAYAYFGDKMPLINPNDVNSINSIKDIYPDFRQDSKMPTFLLTYGGTYIGMMEQGGFTEIEARSIEDNYHLLYKESDEWVADKLKQASKDGYITGAFGLRLRTPLLARTDLNKAYTPYQATKEARTAGNALGQSYCLLNNRAAIEFMGRVEKSEYRLDIKIICMVHDAIYLLIRDNIDVVHWVNVNLVECMSWQDLPEIQHPIVKLSAQLDVFYPSWASTIKLPTTATKKEIIELCKKHNPLQEQN